MFDPFWLSSESSKMYAITANDTLSIDTKNYRSKSEVYTFHQSLYKYDISLRLSYFYILSVDTVTSEKKTEIKSKLRC